MSDVSNEIIKYRLEQAEKDIERLSKELHDFKEKEDQLEKKRLLWGISSLGTIIMALGSILWAYRGVIFK